MRRPVVAAIALLGALLAALLVFGLVQRADDRSLEQAIRQGRRPPAPDAALPRLRGGGTASLADFRGKVVFLNFWASWCDPCREEAPILQRFQRTLGSRGTVLGVTYKDYVPKSLEFVRSFGLTYPSLRDDRLALAPRYGTTALPETFVLDPRGRIVALSRGVVTRRFLDNALREALRT